MPSQDDEFEDGSTLRKKYESTLEKTKSLESELAKYRARDLISEKGFTLVKPEDLEGVEPGKLEERAAALQTERREQRGELARDIFAKQGYEGEELEEIVSEYLDGQAPPVRDEVNESAKEFERVRSFERKDSTPVAAQDTSKLSPFEKLEHGIAVAEKRKRK